MFDDCIDLRWKIVGNASLIEEEGHLDGLEELDEGAEIFDLLLVDALLESVVKIDCSRNCALYEVAEVDAALELLVAVGLPCSKFGKALKN